MKAGTASLALRAGDQRVVARADSKAVLARLLGPLAALAGDARSAAAIEVVARGGGVPARVFAAAGAVPATGAYVALDGDGWIVVEGVGGARIARGGAVEAFGAEEAPAGDAFAERVTIPALAERLRQDGVRLVHAAAVSEEPEAGAWIVPGARGAGKTTLALALARLGATLWTDDRAFLCGDPRHPRVDPWPEPPRVGDRTRFLLPAGAQTAQRDPRTGKALVEALRPPRAKAPLRLAGVLLPRLVEGPGGVRGRPSGARLLSALTAQVVVANDEATAAATLAWLAKALAMLPAIDVDVGSDPERLRPLLGGSAARNGS